MKELCKALDNLPKIVKILLCLPVLDIVWAIYRIGEAVANKNVIHLILGILWIFFGATIGWMAASTALERPLARLMPS